MSDAISQLATFGLEPTWMDSIDIEHGGSGGDHLAKIAWHQAVRIVDEYEERSADLALDENLTPIGRTKLRARYVKDAQAELGKVAGHRDKLGQELSTARPQYRPIIERDDRVSSVIWPTLKTGPLELEIAYRDAYQKKDWRSCDAIETLPASFGPGLDPDRLAALQRERIEAENLDVFAAILAAERRHEAVEEVLEDAEHRLEHEAHSLPQPDADTGSEIGGDGLLTLTISQAAEARG